jgi:hypothetical protein
MCRRRSRLVVIPSPHCLLHSGQARKRAGLLNSRRVFAILISLTRFRYRRTNRFISPPPQCLLCPDGQTGPKTVAITHPPLCARKQNHSVGRTVHQSPALLTGHATGGYFGHGNHVSSPASALMRSCLPLYKFIMPEICACGLWSSVAIFGLIAKARHDDRQPIDLPSRGPLRHPRISIETEFRNSPSEPMIYARYCGMLLLPLIWAGVHNSLSPNDAKG